MEAVLTSPPSDAMLAELETLTTPPRAPAWRRLIGPLLSIAVLIAAITQVRGLDLAHVLRMVPHRPLFWLIFMATYLAAPASEWLIYRRLWRLPARGIVPLLRKRVSNEILLGYSGELYLYDWARRNARLAAAPFGAIKDVSILSAAVGNASTLLLVVLAAPLLGALHLGLTARMLGLSVGTVALSSLATLLFRRSIFSLPRPDLRFIAAMHAWRVIAGALLTALLWHEVMPAAPLAWWLMLSALRMLVSRLPFVPNKDVVFAGVAAFLIGGDADVSALLAMVAGLTLATHLLLGSALALGDLIGTEQRACD
jgi:hypothetical protein